MHQQGHTMAEWIKSITNHIIMKTHFTKSKLKVKGWKIMCQANINPKKAGVAIMSCPVKANITAKKLLATDRKFHNNTNVSPSRI